MIKVNLGPADLSFELWHNGVKLSKDNSIQVEWQSAAPPDNQEAMVMADFPMNSLPAAGAAGAVNKARAANRSSMGPGKPPVQISPAYNRYGDTVGYGRESKGGMRVQEMPVHQDGRNVW